MRPIYTFKLLFGDIFDAENGSTQKDRQLSLMTGEAESAAGYTTSGYFLTEPDVDYVVEARVPCGLRLAFFDEEANYAGMTLTADRDADGKETASLRFRSNPDKKNSGRNVRVSCLTDAFDSIAIRRVEKAAPNYDDNLAITEEMENNEKFFRRKIDGKLTFYGADFDLLHSRPFEEKFVAVMYKDGAEYWRGQFFKTGCEWDSDDRRCEVEPDVSDGYTAVLDGMENEYNLIKLAPAKVECALKKRPLMQLYVLGSDKITNIIGGTVWETDAPNATSDRLALKHAGLWEQVFQVMRVSGAADSKANGDYYGELEWHLSGNDLWDYADGRLINKKTGYRIQVKHRSNSTYANMYVLEVRDASGALVATTHRAYLPDQTSEDPTDWSEDPLIGSIDDTAEYSLYTNTGLDYPGKLEITPFMRVFPRILINSDKFTNADGTETDAAEIPSDDFGYDGHNYSHQMPLRMDITPSMDTQEDSTEWPASDGEYFVKPPDVYRAIDPDSWTDLSLWLVWDAALDYTAIDRLNSETLTLRHAYPLHSCISKLLAEIAPGLKHDGTPEYSTFLYSSENPVSGAAGRVLITPITNVKKPGYDQAAQRGDISLKNITDMLANCFQCYWFIEDGKFRIEHISYFQNGMAAEDARAIQADLSKIPNVRNGKTWAFKTSAWKFDLDDMPERYEFSWADEVTEAFTGEAVEMLSNYVNKGNTEDITVSLFNPDVDYIMAAPDEISDDGFALLFAHTGKFNYNRYADVSVSLSDGSFVDRPTSESRYCTVDFVSSQQKPDPKTGIEVTPGHSYTISPSWGGAWYDAEGTFIRSISVNEKPATVTAPANARYLVVNFQYAADGSWEQNTVTTAGYELPVGEVTGHTTTGFIVQNNLLAFPYLIWQYWRRSFPARRARINGTAETLPYTTRAKTQEVKMPATEDYSPYGLIRTPLGDGEVKKISINLLSRTATITLLYETDK